MDFDHDENQDMSNVGDAASASLDVSARKSSSVRTPSAASRAAAKRTTKTPGTASRLANASMRKSTAVSAGVADLPAATVIQMLVNQSKLAQDTKTESWSHQEKFVQTLAEAVTTTTGREPSPDLVAMLPNQAQMIMVTLGFTVGCGRSGTQRTSLECFRALFELGGTHAPLRDALDRSLDIAYAALVKLVEHNSSVFLASASAGVLRAGMRWIAPGKLAHALAKELLTKAHDANLKKSTTLVTLCADAMDMLVDGVFKGQSAKEYPATVCSPLAALAQPYYKDLLRLVVKLKRAQQPQTKAGADAILHGLAQKGAVNNVLTAEWREFSKTDRAAAGVFESAYKTMFGKELASVTSAAGTNGTLESSPLPKSSKGAFSSTLTSPLPSSAKVKKGEFKQQYAETMPRDILSPGITVMASPAHATAAAAASVPVTTSSEPLREETFALPAASSSSSRISDILYTTAGPGLLDQLSEANACNDTQTMLGATGWNYTYNDSCVNESNVAAPTDTTTGGGVDEREIDLAIPADGALDSTEAVVREIDFGGVDAEDTALDCTVTGSGATRAAAAGGMSVDIDEDDGEEEIAFKAQPGLLNDSMSMLPLMDTSATQQVQMMMMMMDEPTPTSSSSSSGKGVVYNYDRSSMVGISQTATFLSPTAATSATRPTTAASSSISATAPTGIQRISSMPACTVFSPIAAAATAALAHAAKKRHSGQKRKASAADDDADGVDVAGLSSSAATFSPSLVVPSGEQSPRTLQASLQKLTHQIKRHKNAAGQATSAVSHLPPAMKETQQAAELAADLVLRQVQAMRDVQTSQEGYWKEKREFIQARRDRRTAREEMQQ